MENYDAGARLREIMRKYPTGVTVVTSILDGVACGGTMNSFCSVAINPPLVAVFVSKNSRTASGIMQSGKFAINILTNEQENIARTFSADGSSDKFQPGTYWYGESGMPLLNEVLGHIECDLFLSQDIADHSMFVGSVKYGDIDTELEPLVYYNRKFQSLR
ncbi:MAG: flavin reductase family protein [Thermoplasmatales archaeon]|jgi:flavin reductase (DIM6/NTAB) family NADH-FMN oxidoreductase RutF|nr:flavin reductase family protein [Thermoplasmatales archaeon]